MSNFHNNCVILISVVRLVRAFGTFTRWATLGGRAGVLTLREGMQVQLCGNQNSQLF